MTVQTKHIEVVSYHSEWPNMFEDEAAIIKKALGNECISVHHVGSTAVPHLMAKPILDIIAVVKNPETSIPALESARFTHKGEFNIPLHYGFSKRGPVDVNLHVYEEDHPEIELNLLFRDYLRNHPEAYIEYGCLKENLLKDPSSFEKNNSLFTGYNLGKDAFIRRILKETKFSRMRMVKCTHYTEWDFAKKIRQESFFDKVQIKDPYEWTFNHPDHVHLILYRGIDMLGYAHIQFWQDARTALRIIVVNESERNQGLGFGFLMLIEKWLKIKGFKSLHAEASPKALSFYERYGYIPMPFNDPDNHPSCPKDTPMGKML